jgi:5-hydroxyisourate hydrolase
MGCLTTHVLDTANGIPAAGLQLELWRLDPQPVCLCRTTTNHDGRCDQPLLQGDQLLIGTYELRFDLASYFHSRDTPLTDPPFLTIVPIRFAIADPQAHYHVPLLASPWAYSTYRGS